MTQKISDPKQYAALLAYAASHGRTWKAQLNHAWMTGQYDAGDDSSALQQVRNSFGPSWLVRFKLPRQTHTRLKAWPLIKLAMQHGFAIQSSPCLGTYLVRSADHATLTIQESGSFSLSDNYGYGSCEAKSEYAKQHGMTTVQYGLATLSKTLLERKVCVVSDIA